MNRQEIFNRVSKHLLTQMRQARDPITGACLYKTDDNLRCAIGCLIPDNHPGLYARMEVRALIDTYPDLRELFNVDLEFLSKLQDIHDGYPPEMWSEMLKEFVMEYGLSYESIVPRLCP